MDDPDRDEPEEHPGPSGADDTSDETAFRSPLPPDDRLWRHPSELRPPSRVPADLQPGVTLRPRPAPRWPTALASGALGAVIALALAAVTGAFGDRPVQETVVRETLVRETVAAAFAPTPARSGSVVRIASEAGPSVVRIEVSGDLDGSGSGVLFRDDGHVLTNAHVVDEADRIMVILSDGATFEAELVGVDDITDIAVVKVTREEPFPTAVLGSASGLEVGQPTVAIGSPLGLRGGSSVTTGVISALGREVESRDGPPLLDMIQTDAAIAPGSSGGALLDTRGAVIGITTAIAVSQLGAEALGFAVPVDLAVRVASQIIEGGKAVHVWLGIEGRDLDAATATDAGLHGGAEVTDVVAGSPADDVGLVPGDVVTAFEGRPVASMAELVVALRERAPGDVAALTVVRDGVELPVRVTLEERP